MEKKAQKKSSIGYLLSLLDKLAVLLLSLLINNLLGLFLYINNCFNRSPKSGEDAFGASDEKEAESWSSKDDGKGGKRKRKSCMEDGKKLLPSDGSEDVCSEKQKEKKLKQQKENVSESEAGSRKRKREDNDRVQPPSKNLREENHIIYGVTRTVFVGNLPFDLKDEELHRQFLEVMPLNQLLRLFEILTQAEA